MGPAAFTADEPGVLKNISLSALGLLKRVRKSLRRPAGSQFPQVLYSTPRWRDVKNQLLQSLKQVHSTQVAAKLAEMRSHQPLEKITDIYGNVYQVFPDGSLRHLYRGNKVNR